jgi:NAD(P)-dependent dehydrogenase (short-subunit alcohol dehydrogenase family)
MSDLLKNKNIIVVGAGEIGGQIARRCRNEGASIIVWDINDIPSNWPEDLVFERVDITDKIAVKRNLDVAERNLGQIDSLVNAVGIVEIQSYDSITEENWDKIVDVNLRAAFFLMQSAIPLVSKTFGSIVNVGSISGIRGEPGLAHYSASKFGLIGATQALAIECGPLGIRINVVCPGAVDSRMNDLIVQRDMPSTTSGIAEGRLLMAAKTPLRRLCTTDDVASAVLFFLSDLSKFITGQALIVSGGKY